MRGAARARRAPHPFVFIFAAAATCAASGSAAAPSPIQPSGDPRGAAAASEAANQPPGWSRNDGGRTFRDDDTFRDVEETFRGAIDRRTGGAAVEERRRLASNSNGHGGVHTRDGWYDRYRGLDEVMKRLVDVCEKTPRHASRCRLTRVKTTNATSDGAENVYAVLVGANANAAPGHVEGGETIVGPWVFAMAGQHAREWLPIMAAVYAAERMLESLATVRDAPHAAAADVKRIADLLTKVTLVIVPVTNPDGFRHTYRRGASAAAAASPLRCDVADAAAGRCDRMWRKNLAPRPPNQPSNVERDRPGVDCRGVDLNRNWPVDWGFLRGGEHASPDPCHEEYAGTSPFSAPETAAVRDFITAASEAPLAAVDVHAYAQAVLGAWSHSDVDPVGAARIDRVGARVAAAMSGAWGLTYSYGRGTSGGRMYLASGTFVDWAFVAYRIPAYTVELRPAVAGAGAVHGGFEPGVENIAPAGDEVVAGLTALVEGALNELEMADVTAVGGATHTAEGVAKALACHRCEAPAGTDGGAGQDRNGTSAERVGSHSPWVVTLALGYDWYPAETLWELRRLSDDTGGDGAPGWVRQEHCGSTHAFVLCQPGTYEFTLRDSHGDGLCCEHGNGSATLWVDGRRAWSTAETKTTGVWSVQTYRFDIVDDGRVPRSPPPPADSAAGDGAKAAGSSKATAGAGGSESAARGGVDLDLSDTTSERSVGVILGLSFAGAAALACCACKCCRRAGAGDASARGVAGASGVDGDGEKLKWEGGGGETLSRESSRRRLLLPDVPPPSREMSRRRREDGVKTASCKTPRGDRRRGSETEATTMVIVSLEDEGGARVQDREDEDAGYDQLVRLLTSGKKQSPARVAPSRSDPRRTPGGDAKRSYKPKETRETFTPNARAFDEESSQPTREPVSAGRAAFGGEFRRPRDDADAVERAVFSSGYFARGSPVAAGGGGSGLEAGGGGEAVRARGAALQSPSDESPGRKIRGAVTSVFRRVGGVVGKIIGRGKGRDEPAVDAMDDGDGKDDESPRTSLSRIHPEV